MGKRVVLLFLILTWAGLSPVWAVERPEIGPEGIERIYLAQNGKLTPNQKKAFNQLPPEEQRRIRQNYQKFQKMPPPRRLELERRFRKFKQMPPQQQEQLREQYRKLRKLSPQGLPHSNLNSTGRKK